MAYIGLGSNVGDRSGNLGRAVEALASDPQTNLDAVSPIYETEAHILPGQSDAPPFLNAAARILTERNPHQLLDLCLEIERKMGRFRSEDRWLPRTIDIDILLFGDRSFSDDRLTVPHPRLPERMFVLQPLFDLDAKLYIPDPFDSTVEELLHACPDRKQIRRITAPEP